jgi:hypothetical protein
MSPLSNSIESLAARYGVPVLEAQEHWAERAAIREHDGGMSREDAEAAALTDVEVWAKVWVSVKGGRGPQLGLGIGARR